jgi:hypothetical protein
VGIWTGLSQHRIGGPVTGSGEHSNEREMLGPHGGEYEDGCLLGCCAV